MRRVSPLLLLLVALVPAGWAPAGRAGSLDRLCGIDTRLEVAPPAPVATDPVQVIAAGDWIDACVPVYQAHQVIGGEIRIEAVVPSTGPCPTVITPWQMVTELGRLAPGPHRVQLYLFGPFAEPGRVCAKVDLVVRSASSWPAFLPLMPKPDLEQPAAGG